LRSLNRLEASVLDELEWSHLYPENKSENGLTIFIPNWNHRPYLPRAIRSALKGLERLQECGFSGEILVVDDASRDGSQKLLRSIQMLYAEHKLRTLYLSQNLGLPRLRNLSLRISEYRYVIIMDADNELVADNLPLFLQSIVETGAALVHGNLIDKQGERTMELRSGRIATMGLTADNMIDAFALVDAKKLLRVGGYVSDPRLYGYEDWEMMLHLISEEEKVVFVPAAMGYYFRNPGSMVEEALEPRGSALGSFPHRSLVRRMFAQTGTREWDPVRVEHVYHPAVGYIDQW
jgi:succinoglycan biosynthesis protein ExoO